MARRIRSVGGGPLSRPPGSRRTAIVDRGTSPWSSSAFVASASRLGQVSTHAESGSTLPTRSIIRRHDRSSASIPRPPAAPSSGVISHTSVADQSLLIDAGSCTWWCTTPATRVPSGSAAVSTSPSGGSGTAGSIGSSDANRAD